MRTTRRSPVRRRNVTITLDEDVARWARLRAAELDTSVAQLVGSLLKEKMVQEDGYDRAMREMRASVKPVAFDKPGGRFPSREELHDRARRNT